ncbi:hypothetical protein ACP70R_028770 [Stipagrostis hirtigluma subsp. patula]
MGLKLSCIHRGSLSRQVHQPASPPPVRIIAADGSLKELPASSRVAVSDVLGLGGDLASSSSFVCNSNALYFNEHPPPLSPGELLRPGQIYFVLPATMLGRPLSSADMAALAVRATAAIASTSEPPRRRRGHGGKKKVRVSPVREDGEGFVFFNEKLNEQTLGQFGVSLSPARGEQKLAASEAPRRRLKRALSIIREDAE